MRPTSKKTYTPEELQQLRAARKYPLNVIYQNDIIGTMNQRGEIILTDFTKTQYLLNAIQENQLQVYDFDKSGTFLPHHVEIRIV